MDTRGVSSALLFSRSQAARRLEAIELEMHRIVQRFPELASRRSQHDRHVKAGAKSATPMNARMRPTTWWPMH
jgi:hypothetical protein